jgi:hypothetical protein
MCDQAKNWSDIYQIFPDNGQSEIFHILFWKLARCIFLPGHVLVRSAMHLKLSIYLPVLMCQ